MVLFNSHRLLQNRNKRRTKHWEKFTVAPEKHCRSLVYTNEAENVHTIKTVWMFALLLSRQNERWFVLYNIDSAHRCIMTLTCKIVTFITFNTCNGQFKRLRSPAQEFSRSIIMFVYAPNIVHFLIVCTHTKKRK